MIDWAELRRQQVRLCSIARVSQVASFQMEVGERLESRIAAPVRLEDIVLRREFCVPTGSVQAKKGLVTKTDRQAFSSAL